MSSENKIKRIIVSTILGIIIFSVVYFFINPFENLNFNLLNKFFVNIHQTQKIAPARLFINVWRIAKIEYVDKTMNGQDWYKWRYKYARQIKNMDDANVAISSMLASLNDPYTKFLLPETYANKQVILTSKLTGVGVLYNKNGEEMIIDNVLKHSSAQEQELLPGDSIISINNKKIKNMSSDEINDYLKANYGQKIEFVVKRGNKLLKKQLSSTEIPLETMECEITKDNIGIITLSSVMGEYAVENFKKIIIRTNDTNGLIIDLRNNYGGILANAIEMADLIIRDKKLVSIFSRGKTDLEIYANEFKIFKDKPIIILVNKNTASAAEILAGTLKAGAKAIIIGENTFGKNSIQQIIPLANKTGFVLTTNKYILPDNDDIFNKGITPDCFYDKEIISKDKNYVINEAKKIINLVVEKHN